MDRACFWRAFGEVLESLLSESLLLESLFSESFRRVERSGFCDLRIRVMPVNVHFLLKASLKVVLVISYLSGKFEVPTKLLVPQSLPKTTHFYAFVKKIVAKICKNTLSERAEGFFCDVRKLPCHRALSS